MKKIFYILFLLLISIPFTCATEEAVYLQTTEVHHLCNPTTNSEMLEIANYNDDNLFSSDVDEDFLLEEDFSDNKVEKAFSRLINDKMINNKGLKLLSVPIKD